MYQNKIRTMVRSILPSKARVSARKDKKIAHREHRAAIREALLQYNIDDADDDSEVINEMKSADLALNRKTSYNRRERRDADKVNSFVRWAKDKTQHLSDVRSKYYYFISLIGGNEGVIKEHAISHFINPSDLAYAALHGEPFWLLGSRKYFNSKDPFKPLRPIPKEIFYEKLTERLAQLEPQLNQILRHDYKSLKPPLAYACARQNGCFDEAVHKDFLSGKILSTYLIHDPDRCKNVLQLNGIKTAKRITRLLYRFPRVGVIRKMWDLLRRE